MSATRWGWDTPFDPEQQGSTQPLDLVLTPREVAILERAAAIMNLSVGAYVRWCVLNAPASLTAEDELRALDG